ncbi:MAG: pilus assembly protein [Hahellaceae bacterium]|nr:pilus assembly protein [Hahellaceae bacterium]
MVCRTLRIIASFLSCRSKMQLQSGAAMSEFAVTLPVLLLLGLGTMQAALLYNAKNTVTYATFEAARKGAVNHAQIAPMQAELGLRIAPVFGGDGGPEKAMAAITRGMLEAQDPRYTKIEVLNPTKEAFDDFGVINDDGVLEIPNSNLRFRDRSVKPHSKVNIQDANLLKIKVTYAYALTIPLIDRLLPAIMTKIDPDNAGYYLLGRIPVTAVATLRMQSAAYADGNHSLNESTGGSGAIPVVGNNVNGASPNAGEGSANVNPDDVDMGGSFNLGANIGSGNSLFSGNDSGQCGVNMTCIDNASVDNTVACAAGSDSCKDTGHGASLSCPDEGGQGNIAAVTANPLAISGSKSGNPIDVVTGNKFQQEVDIAALSGELGLSFSRYYNSQAAGTPGAKAAFIAGQGWRHTYHLSAQVHGNGDISVVQADGRRIIFEASESPGKFQARVAADGWLQVTDNPVDKMIWHRADGYSLRFNKDGLLLRLISPTGKYLRFTYTPNDQLRQVTDPQGRQLTFDYYTNKRLKKVYDPAGKSLHYRYDKKGNLASVTNRAGDVRVYHYEDSRFPHHLTGITDERQIRFATWAYDAQGRATFSEHANGVDRVTLTYGEGETLITDSQGKQSTYLTEVRKGIPLVNEIRGPGCNTCGVGDVAYEYDGSFQMTRVTYKDGREINQSYDELRRLVKISKAYPRSVHQQTVSFAYEGESNIPSHIVNPSVNPAGYRELYFEFNRAAQPVKLLETGYRPLFEGGYEAIKRETTLTYNDAYQLISLNGPRDDVEDIVTFGYDEKGRFASFISPDGRVQRVLEYDAYGHAIKMQQGEQTAIDIDYNHWGKPLSVSQGDRQVRYEYTETGHLKRIIDPDGNSIELGYDKANRANHIQNSDGYQLDVRLNTEDGITARTISHIDGSVVNMISYFYDAESRLSEIKNQEGRLLLQNQYDANGRVVKRIDEKGLETAYQYGAVGQLVRLTQPGNIPTEFQYDENTQQLSAITDARENQTRYQKDDFGLIIIQHSPDTGISRFDYDPAGNLSRKTNTLNQVTEYVYDAANHLIAKNDAEGKYRFAYNVQGQLESATGPFYEQTYRYNLQGQLIELSRLIDSYQWTTRYQYDNQTHRLSQKTLPGGQVLRYRYHANGRLAGIDQRGFFVDTPILKLLNGPEDKPTSKHLTHGNGIETTLNYDHYGALQSIETGELLKSHYGYDASGQIVMELGQQVGKSYKNLYRYDDSGRLTSAFSFEDILLYEYDKAGNRTAKAHLGHQKADVDFLEYAPAGRGNQLVKKTTKSLVGGSASSVNKAAYSYNDAGSPVNKSNRQMTYSSQQRPLNVLENGKVKVKYAYNSWGERIKKVAYLDEGKETVTYYLYENQKLVAEADESGEVTAQYLYQNHDPVAKLEGRDVYHIHTNHLSTPIAMTDEAKNIVWLAEYTPFGEAKLKKANVALHLRLPGQYFDAETREHYNYYRTYDPQLGRYTTSDPMGLRGGINTYAYVGGNPVNAADPLGLFEIPGVEFFSIHSHPNSDGGHGDILRTAFLLYSEQVGENRFSQEIIDQIIANNYNTDSAFGGQWDYQNHFDNPNDGAPDNTKTPYETPHYMELVRDTIAARRQDYNHLSEYTNLCSGKKYDDIGLILSRFGQNSHTLADFYAHSNWVDDSSRGGTYKQEYNHADVDVWGDPISVKKIGEEGVVASGLSHSYVWDESTEINSGKLITGTVGLYYVSHLPTWDIKDGQDSFDNWDKTTHAYWNKDSEDSEGGKQAAYYKDGEGKDIKVWYVKELAADDKSKIDSGEWSYGSNYKSDKSPGELKVGDRIYVKRVVENAHQLAYELAVQHTVKEIEALYQATESHPNSKSGFSLHDIFKLEEGELDGHNIEYGSESIYISP